MGNPTRLDNWRPINISGIDYRLLASVLHNHLSSGLANLLTATQSSAVPSRQMAITLRVMRGVFEMVVAGEWGVSLVAMDQSKAFNHVHHPYLWSIMWRKGITKPFVRWLQRLYHHAHVCPALNKLLGPKISEVRRLR